MESLIQKAATAIGMKELIINDKVYSTKLLPACEGIVVFNELLALFGPTIASIADNMNNEDFILPEDDQLFTKAVMLLVQSMGQSDVLKIIKVITRDVSCNGIGVGCDGVNTIEFDNHYAGNYGELALVLEWCLKENFKDAFTLLLKAKGLEIPTLSKIMDKTKTPEKTSQES